MSAHSQLSLMLQPSAKVSYRKAGVSLKSMNKFTIETTNDIMRCTPMLLVQIHDIHFKEFSSNLAHTDVAASGGNKAKDYLCASI